MYWFILGVEIVRDISGGKLKGGEFGSTEIVLHPGKVKCGEYSADTGTAGWVFLLIEWNMLVINFSKYLFKSWPMLLCLVKFFCSGYKFFKHFIDSLTTFPTICSYILFLVLPTYLTFFFCSITECLIATHVKMWQTFTMTPAPTSAITQVCTQHFTFPVYLIFFLIEFYHLYTTYK